MKQLIIQIPVHKPVTKAAPRWAGVAVVAENDVPSTLMAPSIAYDAFEWDHEQHAAHFASCNEYWKGRCGAGLLQHFVSRRRIRASGNALTICFRKLGPSLLSPKI